MLSFIRKRLPSKVRSNEHLQNINRNHIQHEHQDNDNNEMKRTKSALELNIDKKKKKKKKEKSSSTLDGLVLASNTSPLVNQINKSYSDVDYFPLMSGALSQSINRDIPSKNRDLSSDCYLNPSESMKTANEIKYVQTTVTKPRVFQIPVIDCRTQQQHQQIPNYKDVDHQRTKALKEVTVQRTEKRSVK